MIPLCLNQHQASSIPDLVAAKAFFPAQNYPAVHQAEHQLRRIPAQGTVLFLADHLSDFRNQEPYSSLFVQAEIILSSNRRYIHIGHDHKKHLQTFFLYSRESGTASHCSCPLVTIHGSLSVSKKTKKSLTTGLPRIKTVRRTHRTFSNIAQ